MCPHRGRGILWGERHAHIAGGRRHWERHTMHKALISIFIGAATSVALGCDSSTAPGERPAIGFEASITGGASHSLRGSATFDADMPGFGIALVQGSHASTDEVRHAVYFRRKATGALGPGDYALTFEGGDQMAVSAGLVLDGDGDDPLFCGATSGTLHVARASAARLDGSFTIDASCAHVGGDPLATPLVVTGRFTAEAGKIPPPDEPTAVAGATYVLALIDGHPVPYLYRDRLMTDESLRVRSWIVADTIHFLEDGHLAYTRQFRQREESTEDPATVDDYEYASYLGGYFRQQADRVAVAWGFITVPADAQYSDTLWLRPNGLVRKAHLPPQCLMCPEGPTVELIYARR